MFCVAEQKQSLFYLYHILLTKLVSWRGGYTKLACAALTFQVLKSSSISVKQQGF